MIFEGSLPNCHTDNTAVEMHCFLSNPQNLFTPSIPQVYGQFRNCGFCNMQTVFSEHFHCLALSEGINLLLLHILSGSNRSPEDNYS